MLPLEALPEKIEIFWITKYWLTEGITQERCGISVAGDYVHSTSRHLSYRLGGDAHQTREGAVARVKELRTRKIASLEKQIAKLIALDR